MNFHTTINSILMKDIIKWAVARGDGNNDDDDDVIFVVAFSQQISR